jgi:hypothetical protein
MKRMVGAQAERSAMSMNVEFEEARDDRRRVRKILFCG